jgi:selenide,water dikinase
LCDLPKLYDDRLLVGFDSSDDAAVYAIDETNAMIQTLDFFTPVVDDPYTFGQIAAANALSDVYAMGGKPVVALNIVCFPNCLPPEILKEILKGGAEKVKESGALLVGGHSIEDEEPKYGLSVSGMVHPNDIWRNIGAKPGDALILTKPLGIGVLTTALKEGMVENDVIDEIVGIMATLNKTAQEVMSGFEVHACTDVTGFGLLGHGYEMAEGSGVTIEIDHQAAQYVEAAKGLAAMGIIPAGAYRNRIHVEKHAVFEEGVEEVYLDLLCDPQTSGGLLVAIPYEQADNALKALIDAGVDRPAIVGRVTALEDVFIKVK